MPFGDDIFNAFFGAVNWEQRVRPIIHFDAPNGIPFDAKWAGSPRTLDKKVAVFSLPGVKGDIVQDLECHADKYSIEFYFDGKDNDKQASLFFNCCKLNGAWTVNHPIHGPLDLQILSVTQDDNPVDHGGITKMSTEWVVPLDPDNLLSDTELSVDCKLAALALEGNAFDQFVAAVDTATEGYCNAVAQVTQGIENVTDMIMSPITSLVDAVDSTFNATQQGIQDTLNATVLETKALCGQTQLLIETPADSIASVEDKIEAYGQLDDYLFDTLDAVGEKYSQLGLKTESTLAKNRVAMLEVALTASFVGTAYSILAAPTDPKDSTGYVTRAQAQASIDELLARGSAVAAALDARQTASYDADATIDKQYFAQKDTYQGFRQLQTLLIQYLRTIQFNLKVEKRFKLPAPRPPIQVCLEEYGDLGEDDQNWDLFCNSNNLHGIELLMLPVGKEIVIYA